MHDRYTLLHAWPETNSLSAATNTLGNLAAIGLWTKNREPPGLLQCRFDYLAGRSYDEFAKPALLAPSGQLPNPTVLA